MRFLKGDDRHRQQVDVVTSETGIIAVPDDATGLAAGIAHLAADADRWARLGEGARRRVRERFSVARVIGDIDALYRELLDRDAKPRGS